MLAANHDATAVTRATEALIRLPNDEPYDVILCDLMMPEMTGMDLHAELSRVAPEQARRIVFMTGGAFTDRARQFLEQVENERIEKPIDLGALKALIQEMMHVQ
jgi:CheY-like chemotaxis protein